MKHAFSLSLAFLMALAPAGYAAETEIKPVEVTKSSQNLGDINPIIVGVVLIGAAAAAIALSSGGGSSTTSTTGTTP